MTKRCTFKRDGGEYYSSLFYCQEGREWSCLRMANIAHIPWRILLVDYSVSLDLLNRSPKTISWYLDILNRYFSFLESNNLLKPVAELGTNELKAYLSQLKSSSKWEGKPEIKDKKGKLSPYSIQGHVRAIKAFWGWLSREEHIKHNPLSKLPLPKVPNQLISTLTEEQIRRLFSGIDKYTPAGMKYYCILLILLDSGVRISELVNIKLQDINPDYGSILVIGKGQKQRIVPVSKTTRKEIVRYLNQSRPQICPAGSPYLFPNSEGKHISINSVQQFLRRLATKAGLGDIKVSPHIFRHTSATLSLTKGANVMVLKDILGHASLLTTQRYVHLMPQDLQKQHAMFSPVENLGITNNHKGKEKRQRSIKSFN